MAVFQMILGILLASAVLSMAARRLAVPYPALLALMGVGIALFPGLPVLDVPPDLILALLVAPILLDASHDISQRDLRRNGQAVLSLVVIAVGLTTLAVAATARWFLPDLPWAAAIALGALLAPPDAVAAIAVMRQVHPPHRIRTILEGESLLNDASSLLIYRLAVAAVAAGGLSTGKVVPTLLLVAVGSAVAGWLLAKAVAWLLWQVQDATAATVLQFVATFGVWLLAEHFGLSGVITIVVFGLTAARQSRMPMPALTRVRSFATWDVVTFVLNVLAFVLVGMQLRRVLPAMQHGQDAGWLLAAAACLGVVVVVRLAWVLLHRYLFREDPGRADALPPGDRLKAALVVGWSGMRGIVTLAAALALPAGFPYRDFILLTAFVVVLGTLLLQGLTLRLLMRALGIGRDRLVERETSMARIATLEAALSMARGRPGAAARRLCQEYEELLHGRRADADADAAAPGAQERGLLRRELIGASRAALDALRADGSIGDDAYRRVEQELDWLELSVSGDGDA